MSNDGGGISREANDGDSSAGDAGAEAIDQDALLRRLAVFENGFTLAAADAIINGIGESLAPDHWMERPVPPLPGRPSAALIDTLHQLLAAGKLGREDGATGAPRYHLSPETRAAALDQLAATGELAEMREAHALYFLAFAEATESRVWTADYRSWMARISAEETDLEAALRWADEVRDSEIGLRLATALWLFWQTQGRVAAGRHWLERGLVGGETRPRTRGAALMVAGLLTWIGGDPRRAAELLDEAIEIWRAIPAYPQGLARSLFARALVAWSEGDPARLLPMIEEALPLFRIAQDQAGEPLCLVVLAIIARGGGHHDQALVLLDEAISVAESSNFTWTIAAARYYEGEIRADLGDYAGALTGYRASIAVAQELGDPWSIGAAIGGIATVAALSGETERAARLFGAADALCGAAGAFLPVIDRSVYERVVTTARANLGETVFATAYAAGADMAPAAMIEEALTLIREQSGRERVPAAAARSQDVPSPRFTAREQDVLRLLIDGRADAEIAHDLGLRRRTVSWYVGEMLKKTGLPSRAALAVYAVRQGLV